MSQTYETTLETGGVNAPTDSYTEPAADVFVSDLEGFSKEELLAFAEELDRSAGPLVSANASAVIYCARLGAEMTLGQAINTIWPASDKGAMVREGLQSVMAEINGMLSTRKEKPADEEAPAEEDTDQQQTEQLAEEIAEAEASSDNEASEAGQAEISTTASENSSGGQVQAPIVIEAAVNVLDYPVDTASENDVEVLETVNAKTKITEQPAIEVPIAGIVRGTTLPKVQSAEAETIVKPLAEPQPQAEIFTALKTSSRQPVTRQETKSRLSKLLSPGPEGSVVPEQKDEEIEKTVCNPVALKVEFETEIVAEPETIINIEPETELLIDQVEELDQQLGQVEEIDLQPIEPDAFSVPIWEELEAEIELEQEPLEVSNPEQSFQISVELEEIENVLLQLTEIIETSEPEITEELNEILDKIIEVPPMLETRGKDSISEAEAQEQLEELFIELFELAGIDYTPELIESLANLIIRSHLVDQIDKRKYEETSLASQGIGTHEVIKKLLAALSFIKKLIARAVAVGKSALKLYNLSFDFGQSRHTMYDATT